MLISCLVKFASKIHTENSARSIVLIFYILCWKFIIKSSKDSQNVTRKGKTNVLLHQQKILLLQVICRRQTHVTKRRYKIFGRGKYFEFKGKSLLTILVKDLQLLDQKFASFIRLFCWVVFGWNRHIYSVFALACCVLLVFVTKSIFLVIVFFNNNAFVEEFPNGSSGVVGGDLNTLKFCFISSLICWL